MRTSMFSEALSQMGVVDVVVIGGPPPNETSWTRPGMEVHHIPTEGRPDTRLALISQISDPAAHSAALRAYGRPLSTMALSAPVLAEAAKIWSAGSWSAIVVSRAHLLPLLNVLAPATRSTPILVDLDDDDGAICREWAGLAGHGSAKAVLMEAEAETLEGLIQNFDNRVGIFTCASDAVSQSLRSRLSLKRINTIANGINASILRTKTSLSRTLIFVGNLSYEPNVDGVLWFISEILPLIRAEDKKIELLVAGSLPIEVVKKHCNAAGVFLHANPSNLTNLYRDAGVAVVPLRSGSGSRIKILEAAVHGLPVVTTQKGAEGFCPEIKRAIFISDEEPEAFARTCISRFEDSRTALARAAQLQHLVKIHHDRDRVISEISALVRKSLHRQ
jgi:glycosyltransferase involved in cell wall biosynthesis